MSAFDGLYEATKGSVYYIALSVLKERSLAEDAMQNCYLKVIRNAGKYRAGTNANAWIGRIAKNEAIGILRARREQSVDISEHEYLFPTYESDGYGNLIDLARRTLKTNEFAVLMLVAEGYKRREIAQMLSLPLPTVTWHYHSAVKKLKAAMEKLHEI